MWLTKLYFIVNILSRVSHTCKEVGFLDDVSVAFEGIIQFCLLDVDGSWLVWLDKMLIAHCLKLVVLLLADKDKLINLEVIPSLKAQSINLKVAGNSLLVCSFINN